MRELENALSPAKAVELFREKGIQVSERALRAKARRLGAYREIGKAMFFLPEDIVAIMAPERPTTRPRGGRMEPQGDYASLKAARKRLREAKRLQKGG